MKAVCLFAPRQVKIAEIPEPVVASEDVLINVEFVGLCGSDLGAFRVTFGLMSYPRIPGHEVSGVVISKGDRVPDSVRLGDKVTLSPYTECGFCPACRVGRPNCCQFNQTLGLQREGALTQRFAIHYSKVFTSRVLSPKELVLVEPLSVGYHASNRGRVSETDTVLLLGCGTIGIGVVASAVRKGAMIIAADIDDTKLAVAERFGATCTVNAASQDVLSLVREYTDGDGVDVAIEAVGLPDTYRLAIEAAGYAGRVVYVGYSKSPVRYDTTDFVRKELDILGSRNALRVFPAVLKMLELRQQPFSDLVTREYAFEDMEQAFRNWDEDPAKYTKILVNVRDT